MAASKHLSEQISNITECSICVETFTDPKVLPCVHTFCLKCLLKYGEHDKPGDQIACPLCRTNFVIPPGGFTDLPNNFFVNKLLLASQMSDASEIVSIRKCDICIEDAVDAAGYCIECDQHFCDKCCKGHKAMKSSRSHQLVSLEAKPSSDLLMKMAASYCVQHRDEQIKFYCYDCKMVTCVVCHVTSHQKHTCSDINKSGNEFLKQLDNDIEKVTSCSQQSRDKLQQLERDNESFLENFTATQQAIYTAYDKLQSFLESNLCQLTDDLNMIKTKRAKAIECKRDELEHQCMIVESFKRYCEEMKEKGTACDISRAANDLHTRSAELVKAQKQYSRQQLDRVQLTFTSSSTSEISSSNLIGTIDCKGVQAESVKSVDERVVVGAQDDEEEGKTEKDDDEYADESAVLELQKGSIVPEFLTKSSVLRVIRPDGAVNGLALLRTELFVCMQRSNQVMVYNLNSLSKSEICKITVPDLKGPRCLAACEIMNCLYISDNDYHYGRESHSQCIHRVDLWNTSSTNWSLNFSEPRGMSLTGPSNLLVTMPQSLVEYTTTGDKIKSIGFDCDLELDNPQHSVKLSSGQFVVCHAGSTQHRVCVVDTAGCIVHSYGGPRGSSTGQLNGPRSLAVDSHDYIFVADCYNHRVVLLSPTLTYLGDVTTPKHELRYPCTLHLDEPNSRLFVLTDALQGGAVYVLGVI